MAWTKDNALKALVALALLAGFARTAYYDWRLIRCPYPLQWREISEVYSAQLVSQGIDPYVMERTPLAAQLYGIGQALVCAPFVWAHGKADLALLRLVNGLFLLASAWVIYAWGRLSSSRLVSGFAALLCYTLWMAQGLPTCKPEGPGLFFFLMSLYAPARRDYDRRGLAYALAFGLAAYFTKPYFLMGAILVGPTVLWKRGPMAALLYTLAFLAAAAAAALAAGLAMPLYHYETCLSFFNNFMPEPAWAWRQLNDFEWYLPGMLALPLLLLWRLLRRQGLRPPGRGLAEAELYFVLMAYLVPFRMSVHTGVYLTYLLELLAPFVALLALAVFNRCGTHGALACAVLAASILVAGGTLLDPHNYDLAARTQAWQRLDAHLDPSKRTLVSGTAAALAYAKGMPFHDTGMQEYLAQPQGNALDRLSPTMQAVGRQAQGYEAGLRAQVAAGGFDRLVMGQTFLYFPAEAARHYRLVDTVDIDFKQTLGLYRTFVYDKVR
jgi:hypothetical protein